MPSDAKTIRKMWELNDENVRLRKVLEQARQAIESAILTHEAMTQDPPWSGNTIMEGCVRGAWLNTPTKLTKALEKIEETLTDPS
jgi:hypothetical protein